MQVYRISAGQIWDLYATLAAFRRETLRRFVASYARRVAQEAILLADAHHLGLEEQDPEDAPILMAAGRVRCDILSRAPDGLDPIADAVIIPSGQEDLFICFQHVSPSALNAWHALQDDGLASSHCPEIKKAWKLAHKRATLRFQMLSGQPLPSLPIETCLRHAPSLQKRLENLLNLWRRKGEPPCPQQDGEALQILEATVRKRPSETDLSHFGTSEKLLLDHQGKKKPRIHSIDHADLIEMETGAVIVLVFCAGLSQEQQVSLQVGDEFFSVVQGSVQFGYVEEVPTEGLDMLRQQDSVLLVELDPDCDGSVVARHRATVKDIGSGMSLARLFGSKKGRFALDASGRDDLEELRKWL